MSIINTVERAIVSLDGGKYQKLMDAYFMRKYQFSNIHPLGVQTGTDKTTKGTPDSYVECDNGKYIIIMYGSVEAASYKKLESDILSCFETSKLSLPIEKIDRIICAYTSTNIHIEQIESLKNLIEGVKIELIGLGTVAHEIVLKYRFLATRFLDIPVDSGQVFDIEEFVDQYDASAAENFQDGVHYRINKDKRRNKKAAHDGGCVPNVLQHPSKQANGSAGEDGVWIHGLSIQRQKWYAGSGHALGTSF